MTDPMELVERMEKDVLINLDWPAAARLEIIKANVERSEAAAIKALTAELKEARALLERTRPYTSTLAVGAADLHSDIRAFLASNGMGEG
jgi:translation initiation factor 2B subunit (eIF-2B alpha/beta/delta family)